MNPGLSAVPAGAESIDETERVRVMTDVNLAGSVLSRSWPLENFIAVNPLAAFEELPFTHAVEQAGTVFGARGTLPEPEYRRLLAERRILRSDLIASLRARHPEVLTPRPVKLGGTTRTAEELFLADFLHGVPAPPPARESLMVSEQTAPAVADMVDAETSKWCSAYLDETGPGWSMPGRQGGFYAAWKDLAPRDRSLPAGVRRRLRNLSDVPEAALADAMEQMGVTFDDRRRFLRAHLTRMPGWAAYIRWREERSDDINLVAYLAMRTTYEGAFLEEAGSGDTSAVAGTFPGYTRHPAAPGPDERAARVAEILGTLGQVRLAELAAISEILSAVSVEDRNFVWLEAYEARYRDRLLSQLERPAPSPVRTPRAQVVCCIDVRSEGLRRHVEKSGPYDTLGFAGFFAVAIRFQNLAGGRPTSLCPVLLEPRNAVKEVPAAGAETAAERNLTGLRALAGAEDSFHSAESHPGSPFVLAEAMGWLKGPLAATKTVFARRYSAARQKLRVRAAAPAPTVLDVEADFTLEERLLFAEVALTMMGLTSDFAPVVVVCGHGSTTENNPYESALDCGACGGNRGAPNARTAAAILNGPGLRTALAERDIVIPPETWFVAAEHDTATDQVTLLDPHLVPPAFQDDLEILTRDLDRASAALSTERCESMPGAPPDAAAATAARHVQTRSADWAEVFPEWGLAGNAAFIIGPRSITRGIDLGRRTFLHSYEAEIDAEGEALETILTAPLVVAQWINCQYYFSTVDPVVFGSGSKVIHNVVGGFGVLAGPGGDLKVGLPWQSVADGRRLVHEPMRLLTVVQAPLERIDSIIERNPVLQNLFGNHWLALTARAGHDEPWMSHTPDGWQPWTRPQESNETR